MTKLIKLLLPLLALGSIKLSAQNSIQGTIRDSLANPVVGATIIIAGTTHGTLSDTNGHFELATQHLKSCTLEISMLGFKHTTLQNIKPSGTTLDITLQTDQQMLDEVVVKAVARMNGNNAVLNGIKDAPMVVSGVSGETIKASQDRDAGEVVRRIPGISILDNKFIVARGLSQRYNNVWINGASVPSSEADSRAFSFDIVPAGQIENIMIVKSPVPELPADFTGGFVKLNTKDTPEEKPFSITYSTGVNTRTHFTQSKTNRISATEWLGFDNGSRMPNGGIQTHLDNNDASQITSMTQHGFCNNWNITSHRPIPDQKLTFTFGKSIKTANSDMVTIIGALNYSYTSATLSDMKNSRFGVWNRTEDKPEYLYKYTDNQYTQTIKAGAMLNFAWIHGNNRYYFRNIFNQIGQNKLTMREGWQNISSLYNQEKTEYNYSARTTYNGQLSAVHEFDHNRVDWNIGYSFAGKSQPDRRIINRQQNDISGDARYGQMRIDQNDIERNFTRLRENMVSATADYMHRFDNKMEIRAGILTEYRTRQYRASAFYYRFNTQNLPDGFAYGNPLTDILQPANYAADKLFLYDDTDNRDSYNGRNTTMATYFAANMPLGKWNIYAGARFEYSGMLLTSFVRHSGWKSTDKVYNYANLFPSINITYNITKQHCLRMAYGESTNRPEFREVSSSVYYDFDLFSDVKGNPNLKAAYIHNVDVRYEWYPSAGETVSFALFYKHFSHPIETTFLDAGGSYTYTFENASQANAYGAELEIRKNLRFMAMPNVDFTFNGSYIASRVKITSNGETYTRPMQGQSPYIINTGLFYKTRNNVFSIGLLYNRIGKRIVGIGKSDLSTGGSIDNNIPDIYEMPRNSLDVVLGTSFGAWEIKLNAKDIIADNAVFCQFPVFKDNNGNTCRRTQVTRKFNSGRTFIISAGVKF